MKRISAIYILALALSANVWAMMTCGASVSPYVDLCVMDSLIAVGNKVPIYKICREIAALDSADRDHSREVAYVHSAIDSVNQEILAIYLKYNIGVYDPTQDSIAPFDYFFDENFEQRMRGAKATYSNTAILNQLFMSTVEVLMDFQPLTRPMEKNAKMRLKNLPREVFEGGSSL